MAKLPKRTALDNYLLTKEIPYFRSEPFKLVATPIWLESEKEWYIDPYVNANKCIDYNGYLVGYKKTYDLIFTGLIDPIEKAEFKQKICSKLRETTQYPNYQYLEYVTDLLEQIESEYLLYKQGLKNVVSDSVQGIKKAKALNDYISNVKDKEAFAKDLKDTFNNEKGIPFKIMIELLKAENILLIGNRDFLGFYRIINPFFNRDIGTYTALNDGYKHTADEQTKYFQEIQIIEQKLKPLIIRHKG